MKQKIVIKVSMHCDKCRTKAMKIAAVADGRFTDHLSISVTSVAFQGEDRDRLLIEGDGVDAACLTESLRKKLCHATLETVEEIKPKEEKEEKKEEEEPAPCPIAYCHQPPFELVAMVPVSDPHPTSSCTIM
ncbi:hypothetical protein SLEP1_g46568 [Rubroshorea leprosula]|uniref:Uncharacterized protein n=1 Tax=Rubroshorea leprosula TaxID=152421 RepID=A0AAV5LPA6_9ROSI|nr:hypothetical protein SLEP1_g46568 [Rubroshorea leprosula]